MIRIKESLNNSVPEWVRNGLRRNFSSYLIKHLANKVDLYRGKFIETDPPKSSRDPILKDSNKLCIFNLQDDNHAKLYSPYVPGLNDFYLFTYRAGADKVSWTKLLSICTGFGYYDLSDPSNLRSTTHNPRVANLDGDLNYGRERRSQYSTVSPDGSTKWSNSGYGGHYDKSGYRVPTPAEMLGRLYDPDESSWSSVLDKACSIINNLSKTIYGLASSSTPTRVSSRSLSSFSSSLENTIYEYETLLNALKSRASKSDTTVDQLLLSSSEQSWYKSDLKRLVNMIDDLKSRSNDYKSSLTKE